VCSFKGSGGGEGASPHIQPGTQNNPHLHKWSSRNPALAADARDASTGTLSAFWLKISISSKMVVTFFFLKG